MKRFYLIAWLLLLAEAVMAVPYSFSGKVENGRKEPVSAATIRLLNTGEATSSNADGSFTINWLLFGKYTAQISAAGYATQTLNFEIIDTSIYLPVKLQESYKALEEVVVTAQKTEEPVQKIPSAITALTAQQVKDYRLWTNKELTGIVPTLYAADPGDGRDATSIRGIATTSYDPAVATYIDGVNQFGLDTYIPALFDVERIEVLRGPQGSLYGRNAMGGIINIITRQPTNQTNGQAELSVGNYGQLRTTAAVRTPLVKNKLFLGVAALYDKRDGFYTNDFNGQSYDDQHSFTGNYYLTYLPSKDWRITLNAKHRTNRNKGAFPLVFGAEDALSNPFHLNQNALTTMKDNSFNGSLVVRHMGERIGFTSQTAFQNNYRFYTQPIDGDFSPLDAISVVNNYGKSWNNIKVFTQDLKINSPEASESLLKWTIGTYIFSQQAPTRQGTRYGKDANLMGVGDSLFTTVNSTRAKKWGIAYYGQLSYPLTEQLALTAGLRYDYEQQEQTVWGEYQHDPSPELMVVRPDTSGKTSFNAFSPKLSLDYQIAPQSMVYALYSRGFRTGGLSPLSSDPSQPPLVGFLPEYSNNFEIGSKNMFLENKLRLNVTLFYNLVNELQLPTLVLPDAITITKNIGKLHSKGVELELAFKPVKGLQLDWNMGYTHARFAAAKGENGEDESGLKGKRQLFTPDITSMLAAQYSYLFGKNGHWQALLRGEWRYLGTTYFDLANNIKQSPYSVLNARAGLAYKQMSVMGWARNLLNKKYIAYAYDFGAVHLGDPSVYGVTVGVGF